MDTHTYMLVANIRKQQEDRRQEALSKAKMREAAPDMLEALRLSRDLLDGLSYTDYPCEAELQAVNAAIEKATGKR